MGTIGDRFGDLAVLLRADGEAAPPGGAGSEPAGGHGSCGGPDADRGGVGPGGTLEPAGEAESEEGLEAAPSLEALITQTIMELNRAEPSDKVPDLDLDFMALDLSGLPLWALVAEVERFLGRKFTDEQVETWGSPRDILRAGQDSGG